MMKALANKVILDIEVFSIDDSFSDGTECQLFIIQS